LDDISPRSRAGASSWSFKSLVSLFNSTINYGLFFRAEHIPLIGGAKDDLRCGMRPNIPALTSLRFFAALVVVFFHYNLVRPLSPHALLFLAPGEHAPLTADAVRREITMPATVVWRT
jgi:hypothetical protein